jgi:peptidoglycan/LPS O-acetylase OafA/YrhL
MAIAETALVSTPRGYLSRVTSSGKLIPEVDGLRFVAILAVVAFHIYEYLVVRTGIFLPGAFGTALSNGQRGVPLFFVISGFILGRPFAMHDLCGSPAPKLKEFYLRRLTRLEPPYVLAIVAVFFGLAAFSTNRGFPHLVASLLYSHNLIYGEPNPFFGLAWSLEIEIQFYCLIPLLTMVYALPRPNRRLLLLFFMFAGVFHLFALPSRINLSILGWIQCFAAGLLLSDLYTDGWQPRQHWGFDIVSIVLWPTVFLLNAKMTWILLPFITLSLYVSAFRSILFRRLFTLPVLVIIGGMCYTIYLVHYPVLSAVGHLAKRPVWIALMSLISIAAASLMFFVLIERPCMNKNWPRELKQLIAGKMKEIWRSRQDSNLRPSA